MTFQVDSFRVAASAVFARGGVDLGGLPSHELYAVSGEVARARRDVDVLMAQVASEIQRRSETADGVGFASRLGFRSAGELLAQATGGTIAEAKRLMGVGDLLAGVAQSGGASDGGGTDGVGVPTVEATPIAQFRSVLAQDVMEGRISVEGAALFTGVLGVVPDDERTRELFTKALRKAYGLSLHKVRNLVLQAQAFSDPVAWEKREDRQHDTRMVVVKDDPDGMVTVLARLTPLAAAPLRAVLDAGVRWALNARRDDPGSDPRTPAQIRADILSDLCRHSLDCTKATTGVKTTVIVRMAQAELESGIGVGEIDGTPQPVTVRGLREAAVDAQIIPVVLGHESDILDWGRKRRFFSETQRLALVERDGGCAWCNAPPAWCYAHHIRWWERDTGPTNLSNGVLLCTSCHTRLHRDRWDIEVKDHVVSFIPPPSVDPARTPRTGGRHRYTIAVGLDPVRPTLALTPFGGHLPRKDVCHGTFSESVLA